MTLAGKNIGFAVCGSFCTFDVAFKQAQKLVDMGCNVIPIMSFNARSISSRFGTAEDNAKRLEEICNNKIISTIEDAEPIGPKKLIDILIIAPTTGNTLAKLAYGITDTPVIMSAKSLIRNGGNVVLAIATNDALANSAKNIGALLNAKNFFFVPFNQDDYQKKPNSMVSDFDRIIETAEQAIEGKQIQPIIYKR